MRRGNGGHNTAMTPPVTLRVAITLSLALATLTACGGTQTPGSSTTPTAASSASTSTPSASPTPSPSSPSPSPTPTASPTPRPPSLALLRCRPSVSAQTGDPIIWVRYQVSDPDRLGSRLVITYRNDFGNQRTRINGRGDKTERFKDYGSSDSSVTPNCKATVTRR